MLWDHLTNVFLTGVVLSIVSPPSIREGSAEPANLCIQLLAVAGGLERESPVGISIPGGNFSQGKLKLYAVDPR